MTVEITYQVTKSFPSAEVFQVDIECLSATDIERAIFVHDSEHQLFTGVATVYDMRTWPGAVDTDLMSYRATTVSRTFTTMVSAESFAVYTEARIEQLRRNWQAYLDAFPLTEVVTVPS